MKKRELKNLQLNKKSISCLNAPKGGRLDQLAITPVTMNKTKCVFLAITPVTPGGGGGGGNPRPEPVCK